MKLYFKLCNYATKLQSVQAFCIDSAQNIKDWCKFTAKAVFLTS